MWYSLSWLRRRSPVAPSAAQGALFPLTKAQCRSPIATPQPAVLPVFEALADRCGQSDAADLRGAMGNTRSTPRHCCKPSISLVRTMFERLSGLGQRGDLLWRTGVAGLLLTLPCHLSGASVIWQGTATGGPADHAFRLSRAFLIYAMATSWGDFQTFAYNAMNNGPSAIGNALLNVVTTANNTGHSRQPYPVNGVHRRCRTCGTPMNSATEGSCKTPASPPVPKIFAAVFTW